MTLGSAIWVGLGALVVAGTAAAQSPATPDTAGSEDLTETVPSENGDVVEQVQTGEATPDTEEPPTEAPAADHAENSRTQLSGYARQSFELVYPELSRRGRGLGEPLLWRDAFLSRTQLVLRASYLKGRSFEATVSGMLGYSLHVAREAPVYSKPGAVDLARGEVEPQLRDAYVGFFWPEFDLRIGQQRVAWGRADFQSPNDVINARDLRNPFLSETELRYLPTPVVRGSFNSGSFSVEAVVAPVFVPDRVDAYGTNWSTIQRKAPELYQRFIGAASLLADPSVERDFAQLWQNTERPQDNGKGLAAGLHISGSLPGLDLGAYYHYGYDSTPLVRIDQTFSDYLAETAATAEENREPAFPPGNFERFAPLLTDRQNGAQLVSSRYVRRHHAGLDLAAVLGPMVLRLDAAYESRRVFYQVDLNSFTTPAVLAVAGLEYQTGNLDDIVLLEFLAVRLLDDVPAMPLLGYEQTSTALAGTLRWTLGEGWGIDLRGLVGIAPETYALQPALRYKADDNFTLRLGALIMSGEEGSFGSYFGDNDTAFVQLRYGF